MRRRRGLRPAALLLVCAAFAPQPVASAQDVGGGNDAYLRLLQLIGESPVVPVGSRPLPSQGSRPDTQRVLASWQLGLEDRRAWALSAQRRTLSLDAIELRFHHNSARPWGTNDGALWQGRGASFALTGGATARLGLVEAQLRPVMTHSANRPFALSPLPVADGHSPYSYPTLSRFLIDVPQRFGPDAFSTVDWGQSSIRLSYRAVSAGFSHENLWWGPGIRNSITMTNNAPGFWHAFLGTSRPADIGVGTLSARWIWGSLRESRWFDSIPSNDRRFVTGAVVSIVPKWTPALELGGSRVFQQRWRAGGPNLADVLLMAKPFQKKAQISPDSPSGDDDQDQMASLFARWVMPESGFELYGEWAKGDHSSDLRDLLIQPEHGSGWLFGFQKALAPSATARWRVSSEVILLGAPRSTLTRSQGAGFFYVHGLIPQGYTHRGQVMGAGIGPGSSQISLRADRSARWGVAGVTLFRTVYDNDRFYRLPEPLDRGAHEVEPSLTGDVTLFRGPWDLSLSITVSQLMNRYYVTTLDRWNTNLSMAARYQPK